MRLRWLYICISQVDASRSHQDGLNAEVVRPCIYIYI
ncbi:unnamed protein product [Arabidopsis halleri]